MKLSEMIAPLIIAGPNSSSQKDAALPVALKTGSDYAIIAQIGTVTTRATPEPIVLKFEAATAATGAFSTIASDILIMATDSSYTDMSEVRLWMTGTLATGTAGAYVIDGVTITKSSVDNTNATAASFKSSGATVCALALETVIPQVCPNLLATRVSTAATSCEVRVYPKEAGYVFDASATDIVNDPAGDGLDNISIGSGRKIFMYDFSAKDIKAKNSSYSHVKVSLSNVGDSGISGQLFMFERAGRFYPPQRTFRKNQFSTLSSAFAT